MDKKDLRNQLIKNRIEESSKRDWMNEKQDAGAGTSKNFGKDLRDRLTKKIGGRTSERCRPGIRNWMYEKRDADAGTSKNYGKDLRDRLTEKEDGRTSERCRPGIRNWMNEKREADAGTSKNFASGRKDWMNERHVAHAGTSGNCASDQRNVKKRGAELTDSFSAGFGSDLDNIRYDESRKKQRKIERKHPIGMKCLEDLVQLPSDIVILELLRESSGYQKLLEQDTIENFKLLSLIKVLAHAASAQSNKESLYEVFNITCKQKFFDKVCMLSLTVKRLYPNTAGDFFMNLIAFLEVYAAAMTTTAADRLPSLIEGCITIILMLQHSDIDSEALVKRYENLQMLLLQELQRHKQDDHSKRSRQEEMNCMEPPDSFKCLSVLPTAQDLIGTGKPFLRQNIVKGKYKNDHHYLDIHFRLLREDFVRPLRNGINDILGGSHSRNRDVRVYRGVTICGCDIRNRQMVHIVDLNISKVLKIENSKRFLYGNFLCFSNDNFKTMFFGSVAERGSDTMKRNQIGVHFDSDISTVDMNGRFIMIESRAYFMAYKHVLKALQEMMGSGIPFAPYILHVQEDIEAPEYLKVEEKYDLRVVKGKNLMRNSVARNLLFDFDDDLLTEEPDDESYQQLKDVRIRSKLMSWPSEEDLGLDTSQRRALRSALTRQLAIIQGPPGTGKTFMGLKVTQILLHNSHVWKEKNNPTPILVICYTNHALDQFLEGMTSFTSNIVRIGSRTKSESISRFQVSVLAKRLKVSHCRLRAIHETEIKLSFDVCQLEYKVTRLQQFIDEIKAPKGILDINILIDKQVIPAHLLKQLKEWGNLKSWLLLSETLEYNLFQVQTTPQHFVTTVENENLSEDQNQGDIYEYADVQEFLGQEEIGRMLVDEETDIPRELQSDFQEPYALYEVTCTELLGKITNAQTTLESDIIDHEFHDEWNEIFITCSEQHKWLSMGLDILENHEEMSLLEWQQKLNIWKLDFPKRWQLYKFWLKKLSDRVLNSLRNAEFEYQKKSRALQEVKDQEYLYLMRHASVVGMTTTGAAKYNNLIRDLSPAIAIIEEAAEILESHVIASVSSKCKHLILIGDHQQLRPSTTVFELATKYGLETSLFERMIKNGLAYETLEYQHRMRPSISQLLVPSIYKELKDHPSVHRYPHVKGVNQDVFFMTHQIHEKEKADDNNSHENWFEAELVVMLCRHLRLQGYSARDITILTPYSGQFFLLRKLQRDHHLCEGVRICVVDNFQGEENRIILLSLVRSNEEGKVGFLRTDNRICVALSRAKEGLYITGNMDLLSASSPLWTKVKEDLIKHNSFGDVMTLKCENHPDQLISVSSGQDIINKCPEGGCLKTCGKSLPTCPHTCQKICHMDDPEHKTYKCNVPCSKILCSLEHPCPRKCWEICRACQVLVKKHLPCGHSHDVHCFIPPDNYNCPTRVERTLPLCQHKVTMPCYANVETYSCSHTCDTRLDCGHQCSSKCHRKRDPDHFEYKCERKCTKINAGCTQNHPCLKKCYEECAPCVTKVNKTLPCGHEAKNVDCCKQPEDVKCLKKCQLTLKCGHACRKRCYEPCGICTVKENKVVPCCNHEIMIECGLPATTDKCEGKCPKMLPCGHPCKERCKDNCTEKCTERVESTQKCPKGHIIKLPCHLKTSLYGEDAWPYCDYPCGKALNCEHMCPGNCGQCLQGRVHASCRQPCERSLVCGHLCTYPCSADCPPCQQDCQWRCKHSRCRKKCGNMCEPCKEKCDRHCPHQNCKKRCGDKCSCTPCKEPCPKKLNCGHSCVGFCGEACPPLCRQCNFKELTEFVLLGNEEDDDARFVWLEDCGHTIEAEGLESWLKQPNSEIGMKTCPYCRKTIYNSGRFQNIILDAYKTVSQVKRKYFTKVPKIKSKDVENILKDSEILSILQKLHSNLKLDSSGQNKEKCYTEAELKLFSFQAQVLQKAKCILKYVAKEGQLAGGLQLHDLYPYLRVGRFHAVGVSTGYKRKKVSEHESRLLIQLADLVDRVMEKTVIIAPQIVDEISSELERLMILPGYWKFLEKVKIFNNNYPLIQIHIKIKKLMDPTQRYSKDVDLEVRTLLKESEKYIGGLGITDSERLMIIKAMGLRQGHWYKCPRGHVYCITECGGAMVEAKCPDCRSTIGGRSHTLRRDNAVATEMDGARHAAWSEHNNMQNFVLNDL